MASTAANTAETAEKVTVAPPSRREFLYYIWGASVVLLLGEVGAGILWFAYPRFAEGTFGGVFNFSGENVPLPGGTPVSVPTGRFHVSNIDPQNTVGEPEGLVVLYGVCTHLGCLPSWTPANQRFECPCHGSKFERGGQYIEGPAPRSLDRFAITVTFDDGTVETTNEVGDPIPLAGRRIANIEIDTGTRIRREGELAFL
jgi:cytochrome b6-f complex iron-sulfur subunit